MAIVQHSVKINASTQDTMALLSDAAALALSGIPA